MELVTLLNKLSELNTGGIIGFFNSTSNHMLLVESKNLVGAVSRLVQDIRGRTFKSNKFIEDWNNGLVDRIEVLYTNDPNNYLERYLKVKELLDSYCDYTLYKPVKFTRLTINKKLEKFKDDFVITVNLVNWNSTVTVGVFNHGLEADKFINENYPNGKISKISYSSNDLTSEFLNEILLGRI